MTDEMIQNRVREIKAEVQHLFDTEGEERYQKIYELCRENKIAIESDGKLFLLQHCTQIWKGESGYGVQTVYDHAAEWSGESCSLDSVTDYYTAVKFAMYRMECMAGKENTDRIMSALWQLKASPDMLYFIAVNELEQSEFMLRLLGMASEDDGEYLQAIRLYRFLEQLGDKEADYVRLSELFLKMKCYDKAYQELKKIKEPSEETAEVITELSQFIQNEE